MTTFLGLALIAAGIAWFMLRARCLRRRWRKVMEPQPGDKDWPT